MFLNCKLNSVAHDIIICTFKHPYYLRCDTKKVLIFIFFAQIMEPIYSYFHQKKLWLEQHRMDEKPVLKYPYHESKSKYIMALQHPLEALYTLHLT
jgi:hypothetical protein